MKSNRPGHSLFWKVDVLKQWLQPGRWVAQLEERYYQLSGVGLRHRWSRVWGLDPAESYMLIPDAVYSFDVKELPDQSVAKGRRALLAADTSFVVTVHDSHPRIVRGDRAFKRVLPAQLITKDGGKGTSVKPDNSLRVRSCQSVGGEWVQLVEVIGKAALKPDQVPAFLWWCADLFSPWGYAPFLKVLVGDEEHLRRGGENRITLYVGERPSLAGGEERWGRVQATSPTDRLTVELPGVEQAYKHLQHRTAFDRYRELLQGSGQEQLDPLATLNRHPYEKLWVPREVGENALLLVELGYDPEEALKGPNFSLGLERPW